jgi:glucose/arabinose dehydrogenase
MHNGLRVIGGCLVAGGLCLPATSGSAQQSGATLVATCQAQPPGAARGRGPGRGRAGQPPGALGRGPARGAPAPPDLPAAESRIPPPIVWSDPPLGDGPFLIESAVPEHRHLRVVVLTKTLNQPWSATWLPDGTMLVTERCGQLRVIRNGVLDPNPVAGVPEVRAAGLQGLMDVVLHPGFEQNRWIYLSYHKPVPVAAPEPPGPADADASQVQAPAQPVAGETTIARGVWNGRALTDVRDIFRSGATNTESSRIGFGRDGMLYMTISAPGTGPQVVRSQDPGDYAGKTIRLRDDGTVPPDNPFVGRPGYKPGIYTLGHRNGHSMALNPETGEFWVTEQGPNGGDEINVLKPGANYGWPYVSHGRSYMGPKISENPWREGTEQPVVFWVPSIAVAGGTFYTGDRFPGWKRNLFVGGMRFGEVPRTGELQRIEFNEHWEELRREPLLRELHQRIRDVRQGPDGLLYVLTAENPGAVLRVEPVE